VLSDAAEHGLPGEHHFFITFLSTAEGVKLSPRLLAQYPEEMTVILQHQFWDLTVSEDRFEVGLSFGGIPEKLGIPFEAISGFFDPSVQFGLQFEEVTEGEERQTPANAQNIQDRPVKKKRVTPPLPAFAAASKPPAAPPKAAAAPADPEPDKPASGGEVVRLDRFRKKK
jgi:hypothetical protein